LITQQITDKDKNIKHDFIKFCYYITSIPLVTQTSQLQSVSPLPHRPSGWNHVPAGRRVPCGESCQWGDYHFRELALMIARDAAGKPPYRFFTGLV